MVIISLGWITVLLKISANLNASENAVILSWLVHNSSGEKSGQCSLY